MNKQRNEYQTLFEHVPCYITVQDRELKLLQYNQEFARKFMPERGIIASRHTRVGPNRAWYVP